MYSLLVTFNHHNGDSSAFEKSFDTLDAVSQYVRTDPEALAASEFILEDADGYEINIPA